MTARGLLDDERSFTWRNRTVGVFGPVSSSLLLVWLASHRGRLRTLLLGGHRLSVLMIWDGRGNEPLPERDDLEAEAMAVVVFGPPQKPSPEAMATARRRFGLDGEDVS